MRDALRPFRPILERLFPDHRSYGWRVVAACFACGALSAPGQSYALGLYFESFVTELGLTKVTVSSVYAWATLAAAALLPFLGRLADRSSSRRYLGLVVAGMGATLLALGTANSLVGLALGLFCLRLLGQGAIGLGTITIVLRWFDRHRGRAAAIAALGYAFGEFTVPAIITALQAQVGWRGSMLALGGAYLPLALLIASVLRDPRRSVADGGGAAQLSQHAGAAEWMLDPVFWAMVVLSTILPAVLTGVALHQLALFRVVAWSAEDVVPALRAYAIANLVTTYGAGVLLERVASKFGVALSMTTLSLAVAVPLLCPSLTSAPVVFWGLLGAAAGSATGTHGLLWPEYFGVASIGAIKGVVNATRNAATAAGAVAFAALAGPQGDYRIPLLAAATLAGMGLTGALLLPRPYRGAVAPSAPLTETRPSPAATESSL